MTALEALEELKNYSLVTYDEDGNEEDWISFGKLEPNIIEAIEKELIVLAIIKKKNIDILNFKFADTLEEYNNYTGYDVKELTQEEFDLLKEMLK